MISPRLVAKSDAEEPASRLAVLIDADNAQAAVIEPILAEIARYGEATVRRIYVDFTSAASASWKRVLQKNAIKPVQQFAYTTGKNATDSSLIIDAMDLLYSRKFDGFCLVTSDSDFTGLAMRLREEGLMVLGFGENKTPDSFRSACHRFILTEVLRSNQDEGIEALIVDKSTSAGIDVSATLPHGVSKSLIPIQFLLTALEQSSDESGWSQLGTFGSYLTKIKPDFDSRAYGFKKLSELVKSSVDLFITEERVPAGQQNKQLYLRRKK